MKNSLDVLTENSSFAGHKKQVRRYANTDSNWKQKILEMDDEQLKRLIFEATIDGNKKLIKYINESTEIGFDYFDMDGNSPLMYAVKSGKTEVVEYILKNCEKIDYVNILNKSPLMIAVRKNSINLVNLLLEYGADVNFANVYNQNALFDAVIENNTEMIDFLVSSGANLEHQNKEGVTPLMLAATNKTRQESLLKLLKLGANVKAKDYSGKTAFMHAINNNNGAMMDILLKAKSEINVSDKLGYTPLMLCAKRGNREGVRVLISRQADVFAKNIKGETALAIAKSCGNATCYEVLAKAEKILTSDIEDYKKFQALKEFASHNRVNNSCIK